MIVGWGRNRGDTIKTKGKNRINMVIKSLINLFLCSILIIISNIKKFLIDIDK